MKLIKCTEEITKLLRDNNVNIEIEEATNDSKPVKNCGDCGSLPDKGSWTHCQQCNRNWDYKDNWRPPK